MAEFKISGVWKDEQGVITHYAIHTRTTISHTRAVKTSKAEAVRILSDKENSAYTWHWNYSKSQWDVGGSIHVVEGRFLRSNHDNQVKDNLGHLINYNWIVQ